jgi:hypothetical protein
MTVIYVRSPYTISIDEVGQIATKIELRIWYNGDTKPTEPTYPLERQIPSITQTETYYNIAPYIKDYIQPINPNTVLLEDTEVKEMYALVEVITFYTTDGTTWEELDTLDFVAVNGFTNPNLGANQSIADTTVILTNTAIEVQTNKGLTVFSGSQNVEYFNILVDWLAITDKELRYLYKDLSGGNINTEVILTDADAAGIYALKVPYRLDDAAYVSGNTIEIRDTSRSGALEPFAPIRYVTVDECKYTPVRCDFINRQGGWQTIVFFKAQTNSFEFKSSEFSNLVENWDYDPLTGGSTAFNFEAKQTVKLNTGWVKEDYINFMFDLLASETVLLDNVPAKLKSKSLPYKTQLKDRNINYEIDFEYTYNLINDVQ